MKSKPYTLVIANGDIPPGPVVRSLSHGARRIVCADGGANIAARFHIRPDAIVGDLDSLTPRNRKKFASAEILHRPSQYATDLEKALDYCIAGRLTNVVIVGAAGKRFDHALSNVSIIRKYHTRLSIRCVDSYGEFFIVTKSVFIDTVRGQIISLVPLGTCSGITTSGLMYELRNGTLEVGVREGQSNVAIAQRVGIRLTKGSLLVFRELTSIKKQETNSKIKGERGTTSTS